MGSSTDKMESGTSLLVAVGKNLWEPVYKRALGTKVGDHCADNRVGSPGTHVSLSPILQHKGGPPPLGRNVRWAPGSASPGRN